METKSLGGLLEMMRAQVANHTAARFKVKRSWNDLADMLRACYQAEVAKRGIQISLDNAVEERIGKAAKWLMGECKPGLLLYGATCGTGKTTLASAICTLVNYLFDSNFGSERKSVYRITAINLVKVYQENPDSYKKIMSRELLYVDDLGTEPVNLKIYGNEFSPVTELLYHRYDRQMWTIVTSNLSDRQLLERYGARIDDRMREMFDRIHFRGSSYRR